MTDTTKKTIINNVFKSLKTRDLHPSGTFDKKGRFYAENSDLINVRKPSAAWPYSEMAACRTEKYVTAVCNKFDCKTETELRSAV